MPGSRTGEIRIGTSGWDFEDWSGLVYPPGRDVDRLQSVARFVDVVEIDGYRAPLPGPVTMARVARWGHFSGLRFTVVAPHALLEGPTRDLSSVAAHVKGCVAPLAEAGTLACVLLQVPQGLHHDREGARRVAVALAALEPHPRAVEARHASWDRDDVRTWLASHGIGWCNLDQPGLPGAMPPTEHRTSPLGLVRLHGRDRERWFARGPDAEARHGWRYATDALRPWAERVERIARGARETLVVATTWKGAAALATCAKLRALIEPGSARAPAPLFDDAELAALGVRSVPLGEA